MLLINGVCMWINIVITNLIQVDLVLKATYFHGFVVIVATRRKMVLVFEL